MSRFRADATLGAASAPKRPATRVRNARHPGRRYTGIQCFCIVAARAVGSSLPLRAGADRKQKKYGPAGSEADQMARSFVGAPLQRGSAEAPCLVRTQQS